MLVRCKLLGDCINAVIEQVLFLRHRPPAAELDDAASEEEDPEDVDTEAATEAVRRSTATKSAAPARDSMRIFS